MGEKIAAIVLAAGEGKRMGSGIPKQYMLIKSRPLVYYALKAFEESAVDEVILVTGEDEIDYCKEYIVDRYHFNKVKKIVPGGWERYASVYFGLEAIEDADYVLIHDGARPMISAELVQKCIYYVKKYRACVVGMPSKDTIKVVDEENYAKAYEKMMENDDGKVTDDAMVVETYGNVPVKLFEGGYDNIKITTPEDVRLATNLVRVRKVFHKLHVLHDKLIYLQMKAYKKRFREKKQKK